MKNSSALGETIVSVHCGKPAEAQNGRLRFVSEHSATGKNFRFKSMPFSELLQRAVGDERNEHLYLRAVGPNPRRDRADVWRDFPHLIKHANLDMPGAYLPSNESYFSSVLRIASSGLQLWTHFDVMDNVLLQFTGRKRVILFRPEDAVHLHMIGSASPITDIDDCIDPDFCAARARAIEVILEPGDALAIPALWPHNVTALEFSVAINVFWRGLPKCEYASKDLYGNRDPVLCEEALELVTKAAAKLTEEDATTGDRRLGKRYVDFYARKAAKVIMDAVE